MYLVNRKLPGIYDYDWFQSTIWRNKALRRKFNERYETNLEDLLQLQPYTASRAKTLIYSFDLMQNVEGVSSVENLLEMSQRFS